MLPLVSGVDAAGALLGVVLALLALLGLAVRYVLVPYLRDHLVGPVQETHKQVTQNRHANPEPTLLDRLDDVHDDVRRLADTVAAVQAVANAAARSTAGAHRRLDQHMSWADVEVSRLWSATRPRHLDTERESQE